jgi:hypothetical protein
MVVEGGARYFFNRNDRAVRHCALHCRRWYGIVYFLPNPAFPRGAKKRRKARRSPSCRAFHVPLPPLLAAGAGMKREGRFSPPPQVLGALGVPCAHRAGG